VWACVKRWVINPALNCPRLMDDERRCGGGAFQTVGTAHGKSVGRAVFLSKGQACRGVLPSEDLPTRKSGDWDSDAVEVGKTVLTDTVSDNDVCRGCRVRYNSRHEDQQKEQQH